MANGQQLIANLLLLPLHCEVAEPIHCKAWQHLTDWNKCLAPPIRYDALALAPQRVQTTTSAERWLRQGVQLQADALPLLVQAVEVCCDTRRANRCNPNLLLAHLLRKCHRERLCIGLRCAIQRQTREWHPH